MPEPNLKSSFGLPRCLKTGLWTPTETHAWGHSFYNIFFRELTHKLKIDIRVCKLFDFVQIHTYECENSFIVIQVHIYECANSLIGLAHKLKHECEKWFDLITFFQEKERQVHRFHIYSNRSRRTKFYFSTRKRILI